MKISRLHLKKRFDTIEDISKLKSSVKIPQISEINCNAALLILEVMHIMNIFLY